jgi:predicted N-acetyltransferase YhbS
MTCSQIRPARAEEATGLAQLAVRATEHDGYDPVVMARLAPVLQINLALIAAGLVFVAEDVNGTVIGVVAFRPLGPSGLFLLEGIFVEPAFMRRGVGRRLIETAAGYARKLGGCAIVIYANPTSAGFYARLGAIRIGTSPFVFSPDLLLPVFAFPLSPLGESAENDMQPRSGA